MSQNAGDCIPICQPTPEAKIPPQKNAINKMKTCGRTFVNKSSLISRLSLRSSDSLLRCPPPSHSHTQECQRQTQSSLLLACATSCHWAYDCICFPILSRARRGAHSGCSSRLAHRKQKTVIASHSPKRPRRKGRNAPHQRMYIHTITVLAHSKQHTLDGTIREGLSANCREFV